LATARDVGITSLNDPNRYGLTLVLGGGEVSLLELTSAYGVFANEGTKNPARDILTIKDNKDNTIFQSETHPAQVIDINVARAISNILSDNKARTPAFGEFSALYFPGKKVAAKTGTTNDYRDAWVLGYTPSIAVGAWSGNNDNTPMQKKVAGFIVAPWWHEIMEYALLNMPSEDFINPDPFPAPKPVLRGEWRGGIEYTLDKISGKLATVSTPKETTEEKVITNVHSILYWVNKNDILGPAPANPSDDPQFSHWEMPIQAWWTQNKSKYPAITINEKPSAGDDVHTGVSKPLVSILEPNNTTAYKPDQKIQLKITNLSPFPLKKIDIFINGIYSQTIESPFNFSFTPSEIENIASDNELKIISYNTAYNKSETISRFKVEQ